MTLEEMEQAQKELELRRAQRPMFRETVKHEMAHINWRLVIAISFGFLLWHSGQAIFERLFK